jgi:hypothetical protein
MSQTPNNLYSKKGSYNELPIVRFKNIDKESENDDCKLVTISSNGMTRMDNPSVSEIAEDDNCTSLVERLKSSLNVRKKLNMKALEGI